MLAEPWMVSGSGRFDTDLMTAAGGTIVAKGGAEGVHADALVGLGAGFVLKTIDGAARAVPPATLALLGRLGALDADSMECLRLHARPPLLNVAGRAVGELRARSVV
jgi:L-asparaginase II